MNYVAKDRLQLIRLSAYLVDLPQVDLMNFRVEYVRSQSGRGSDEVTRGRLVSLEGFSFAFRAKKMRSVVTCNWYLRLHLEVHELNGGKNLFHSN